MKNPQFFCGSAIEPNPLFQKPRFSPTKNHHFILYFLLSGIVLLSLSNPLQAQCNNPSAFATVTAPTNNTPLQITTCVFGGEYNTINSAVAGRTYMFTGTGGTGNYLTVRQGTPAGVVLGFGFSPISVMCTVSGPLYLHVNTNAACGTESACHTTTITCTSCAGAADPCSSISTISCGVAVSSTPSGAGLWNVTACGFSTPGMEKVYSFTAPSTGAYTLQVNSVAGGYIDYFYKAASVGCNANSWLCIDDINFTGSFPIGTLTAGTQYYILLDPEATGSYTHNFQINCPVFDPCASITSLTCSTPTTANTVGAGAWSPNSCGFSTPGMEKVHSFTPTVTGMHTLVVTAASGGYADYFYKAVSGGCNSTGWTCIGDATSPESDVFGPLTSGTAYYILFDSEVQTAASQTFRIDCPSPPAGCIVAPTSPADNSIICPSATQTLSWPTSGGAVSYDVYFGTTNPPPFLQNTPNITLNVNTPTNTAYFWQIRPVNTGGQSQGCPVWKFTKQDITAPTITCAPSVVANATQGLCSAVVTYGSISASDNCTAPSIVLVSGPLSGSSFPVGITTIVYRATDAVGNSSTCSFTVTVIDNQPPTITCPANVTVQCASLVPPANTGSVIATDNCGAPTITLFSSTTVNQTCANRFQIIRTYRATDASGNTNSCTQTITVNDNTKPTITFTDQLLNGVPNGGTVYIQCYGQDPDWDPHTFSAGSATASDNCSGNATLTFNSTLVDEGNCPVEGYINRYKDVWNATDVCGNTSSAYVYVELIDEIPPVLHGVPNDVTVNCDEVPAMPPANAITAEDECLCACTIAFSATTPFPGCQDGQVITRKWTATDACGNSTTGVQRITLVDNKGPVMHLNLSQLLGVEDGSILQYTCNEGGFPAFYNQLNVNSVTSENNCGTTGQIKYKETDHDPYNCEFFGYFQQRKFVWTGLDQCGNESTFTLIAQVIDDEPPVLINVPDIACAGDPSLNLVEAIDNCEKGNVRFWDVAIPNPCGVGTAYRRTYEGFDPCGNMVRDTTIILPEDHTAPTLQFAVSELAELGPGEALTLDCNADGDGGYTSYGTNSIIVQDACIESIDINFEEKVLESGGCENGILSSLELKWTASDRCGNVGVLTALVNVVDHDPPVFVNDDAEITIGCHDALPQVQATDHCSSVNVSVNDQVIPGPCTNEYDVDRTSIATDACGNITTLHQLIHVGDNDGPVIVGVDPLVCNDLSLAEGSAYDECSGQSLQVHYTQDTLYDQCEDALVITRLWEATDGCGRTSSLLQRIIIGDRTPPVINIPTNSIILEYLDHRENYVALSRTDFINRLDNLDESSVSVKDDCGGPIIPVFSEQVVYVEDCEAAGFYEIRNYTWTASDICGNKSTISFNVHIIDDVAPVITEVPAAATYICTGLPPAGTVQAEDYTEDLQIVYNQESHPGAIQGSFEVTRTWTVTDECGNVSTATQHILWIPDTNIECEINLPPQPACNTHGVVIGSTVTGGLGGYTYDWKVEGVDCYIQSGQGTPSIAIYMGFTIVDITLRITDAYGCTTECEASLECTDPLDDFNVPSEEGSIMANGDLPESTIKSPWVDNKDQIRIWPNPAREYLNVSYSAVEEGNVQYEITDLMGQVVVSDKMNSLKGVNTQMISTSGLPDGTYLIQLKIGDQVHTRMLVIIQ